MSLSPGPKPLNANRLRTSLNFSTAAASHRKVLPAFVPLFLLAALTTLTIWNIDPLVDRAYECSILLLAAWTLVNRCTILRWAFVSPLAALSLWGFCEWGLGSTVDRGVTWAAALRFSGLAATALAAYGVLGSLGVREQFLKAIAWFGFLVATVSVLAYYASPGRVLWLIEAPYPDVWGPFLSRNNFAQFLELTLPIGLWLASRHSPALLYGAMSAVILAAGLASASRAGAILLGLETFAFLSVRQDWKWKRGLLFGTAVLVLSTIGGAQAILGRFSQSDPLAVRRQIYVATGQMIASRPIQGYGLGTYGWVYPRFATTDFGYRIEHAHNDWLEWSGEGGLGFVAIWIWMIIRATRKALSHPWGWGVPALFLHAFVDFPTARFGVAAWAFILIGAIEASETRPPKPLRRTT